MQARKTFALGSLILMIASAGNALAAGDIKKLQGSWSGIELGREEKGRLQISISDQTIEFSDSQGREWYKAEFELDEEASPKKIFITIKDCPIDDFVDQVSLGIYRLENGVLEIAATQPGAAEGPKGFEDPACRVFELNRLK